MDQPIPSTHQGPLDPDPTEWLSPSRLEQLKGDLLSARSSLAMAGLLPRAVNHWLRQQLAAEAPWSTESRQGVIDARESKWRESVDIDALGLLDNEVPLKLAIAPGCQCWAEAHWGHRLESLFLQRKSDLDKASCRLLRVRDKGLALELFHRIKAGEDSFSALARRFSEGPEKAKDGLIPLQSLASLPFGLDKVLPKLEPGELMPPSRLGKYVAIVQLEVFKSACFDESTRNRLLAAELDRWLESVGAIALAHLKCPYPIDAVIP